MEARDPIPEPDTQAPTTMPQNLEVTETVEALEAERKVLTEEIERAESRIMEMVRYKDGLEKLRREAEEKLRGLRD